MSIPKIHWVVGRKGALGRAVAMALAKQAGHNWAFMKQGARDQYVEVGNDLVQEWVTNKVLAQFQDEYREPEST